MKKTNKYKTISDNVSHLSLGISIVVAVVIGVGIGIFLQRTFDSVWYLFLGIAWGLGAAFLNVYKAYKKHQKDFTEYEEIDKKIKQRQSELDINLNNKNK